MLTEFLEEFCGENIVENIVKKNRRKDMKKLIVMPDKIAKKSAAENGVVKSRGVLDFNCFSTVYKLL